MQGKCHRNTVYGFQRVGFEPAIPDIAAPGNFFPLCVPLPGKKCLYGTFCRVAGGKAAWQRRGLAMSIAIKLTGFI